MVTRTAQPGVTCTAARCWTYDADCSMLFVTPNSNEGDFEGSCQGSVVENDGFTLGAEAGGLADVGTAWKWDFSTGNPEIVLEAGKSDSNLVRLRGNGGFADLLYQDSLPMLGAKRLKLSIGFRPIPGLVLPGTELVVRISTKKQDSLLCDNPNTCLELLRLPISETDTLPDWSVTGSYDSTTFAGRYLSIHVENPFFDDDLGFMSVVDIDNICLIPYNFISVKDLAKAEIDVRLFPNPSTGQLVVEWHGADLKSASVQIVGPLGQTLRTLPVSSGATRLETQVSDLPSGIYFVKVLTEHRLVKVLKFVKQ